MCDIIKIGETTAIICGGEKDHKCNEDAGVYETKDGKRHFFKDRNEDEKWYSENYKDVLMASVACSICGSAAFDNAWKIEE